LIALAAAAAAAGAAPAAGAAGAAVCAIADSAPDNRMDAAQTARHADRQSTLMYQLPQSLAL